MYLVSKTASRLCGAHTGHDCEYRPPLRQMADGDPEMLSVLTSKSVCLSTDARGFLVCSQHQPQWSHSATTHETISEMVPEPLHPPLEGQTQRTHCLARMLASSSSMEALQMALPRHHHGPGPEESGGDDALLMGWVAMCNGESVRGLQSRSKGLRTADDVPWTEIVFTVTHWAA